MARLNFLKGHHKLVRGLPSTGLRAQGDQQVDRDDCRKATQSQDSEEPRRLPLYRSRSNRSLSDSMRSTVSVRRSAMSRSPKMQRLLKSSGRLRGNGDFERGIKPGELAK